MGKESLPAGTKIPHHLAIIPDGNRRWAKERGLPTFEGHRRGFDVAVNLARACRKFGIHTVTIWGFSTENWRRSKEEVSHLMKLYEGMISKFSEEAKKEGVKLIHLGRKDRLPKTLIEKIKRAEEETKSNERNVLNVGLDYGGRDEIVRAIDKWRENSKLKTQNSKLTEEEFAKYLDTSGQPYPYPDLLIRPSGEMRISGFLLWQTAYTEFYFIKKHLPDCTVADLKKAILDYSQRERRFGK